MADQRARGRAWSECLTEAAFAVNAADLSFAPFSPFYLMHGFQPRIKADIKCLADKDDKTLKKLMREMPDLSEYVAARDPKMAELSGDPSKNPCHNLLPLRTRERLG